MSDGKRILNQIHDYRATNVIGFIAMTATIHQERSQGVCRLVYSTLFFWEETYYRTPK